MTTQRVSHTPGPWEVHHHHDVTGYPCFFIHGMAGEQKYDTPVLDANARLIASAPDLLAVLREAAETLEKCRYSELPMARKCREVIAKASAVEHGGNAT